ncbi:hypothetical protein P9112_000510 [Eukaryota sp. TZLM1-RC]
MDNVDHCLAGLYTAISHFKTRIESLEAENKNLKSEVTHLRSKYDKQKSSLEIYRNRNAKYALWITEAHSLLQQHGLISPQSASHDPLKPTVSDVVTISDDEPTVEVQQSNERSATEKTLDAWGVSGERRERIMKRNEGPPSSPFDFWIIRGPDGEEL